MPRKTGHRYWLTREERDLLRKIPINPLMPNRLKIAMAFRDVKSIDLLSTIAISSTLLSQLMNPYAQRASKITTLRRIAECFGCLVDDIFPSSSPQRSARRKRRPKRHKMAKQRSSR